MTDHLAVLEEKLASSVALAEADPDLAPHLQPEIDAYSAAIALMRGQSWQDIATAPKGKHVIVWDGELMLPSYWGKVSHVPIYGWLNLFNDAENVELMDPQPTLWTHYPDRPRDTADEQ